MIKTGILNPQINSLLSRVRHTNTLVIADRGFPFWPQIETVDISLVDDVPTVLQVLAAVRAVGNYHQAYLAREFQKSNTAATRAAFAKELAGIPVEFEPHVQFKKRVPGAIGLIRTGDTVQYANTDFDFGLMPAGFIQPQQNAHGLPWAFCLKAGLFRCVLGFQFLPEQAVNGDEHEADQRHHQANAHRVNIGDVAHERRAQSPRPRWT